MKHAIRIHEKYKGDPKALYHIVEVWDSGLVVPVHGPFYTLEDAKKAADSMGLTVSVVGDHWQIL